MASSTSLKILREEATCPICLEFFSHPVMLIKCGHNFCRDCLDRSWRLDSNPAPGGAKTSPSSASSSSSPCPECRQPFQRSHVRVNRSLASLASVARELSLERPRGRAAGGGGPGGGGRAECQQHQEPLKLFCQEDRSPLCVVCRESRRHRAHTVLPLEEAEQEYKDLIQKQIDILRKQKEETAGAKWNSKLESHDLLWQINAERQKVVAEFQGLHQLVEGRKRLLLARLGELDKKVSKMRDEHIAKLSKECTSLENLIQEMEVKCQQPATEFLQNIESMLQRCEMKTPQNSVAFPPEIRHQIEEFSNINTFLQHVMSGFQESFLSEHQLWKEDIILDPDTAHPDLSLSKDHRSVRLLPSLQNLPDNLERFDTSTCILAREGFITGKHWWEVEVEERGIWAVGVAVWSVKRKGPVSFCPEEGIWAVGQLRGGHYQALATPKHHLLLTRKLRKIRVTIDYENEQVAFLDPEMESPIFVFSSALFKGEVVLPWFWVGGLASQLRLSL
ncbi:zinc finger protein RFP-like [Sceloporus undulatus]|uniref:zinc finger protein RFP-like n=1 Tax=Sceloporus undulatus TaxID=8520 RepID=UPI001C4A9E5C|nr:zinc finger protein RFP-like [Sceloporus undulatus]